MRDWVANFEVSDLLRAQPSEVQSRIDELQQVIERTLHHRGERLGTMAERLHSWRTHVLKQKSVYRTLNMWNYDLTRKCLIAEAWCPLSLYDETKEAIRRGASRSGAHVPSVVNIIDTDEKPPTYFHQNKFTAGFQAIVDGYGVPRCGEINPAAFTIITYPFLFGVMFGDVGHGFLVLCLALYFIKNERRYMQMREEEIGEIFGYPWRGRYVLLLMSLFSIYCGMLYNDTFGLMADVFGTAYDAPVKGESRARSGPDATYLFRIDPAAYEELVTIVADNYGHTLPDDPTDARTEGRAGLDRENGSLRDTLAVGHGDFFSDTNKFLRSVLFDDSC